MRPSRLQVRAATRRLLAGHSPVPSPRSWRAAARLVGCPWTTRRRVNLGGRPPHGATVTAATFTAAALAAALAAATLAAAAALGAALAAATLAATHAAPAALASWGLKTNRQRHHDRNRLFAVRKYRRL